MPVDFSDHHLWSSSFKSPPPIYKTIITRERSRLDIPLLLNIIESSFSVDVDNVDVDVSASRLHDAIPNAIDQLIPQRSVCILLRISDPWFDRECRDAKRVVRPRTS